jgi:cation diffusion facilitator CzcD-associated flavoprotein CzcO
MKSELFEQSNLEVQAQQRFGLQNTQMLRVSLGEDVLAVKGAMVAFQGQIRFDHEILDASWDDDAQRWRLETAHGVFTADVLVAAVGALSDPSTPALPGLDRFAGKTFHSARWNHEHDLKGRRVAVIGTGASAIQFIPHIQPKAAALKIFQRTPPWIVPRGDRA